MLFFILGYVAVGLGFTVALCGTSALRSPIPLLVSVTLWPIAIIGGLVSRIVISRRLRQH